MHFQLKFVSFGGAKIDLGSIKVTYLKTPNVDLTSRILSFALATGVDIPDAELPVGDHMIRVDLKDSDGRSGSTSFVLEIVPWAAVTEHGVSKWLAELHAATITLVVAPQAHFSY
jgi:hypothetical protein